jgi:hypothetical protein
MTKKMLWGEIEHEAREDLGVSARQALRMLTKGKLEGTAIAVKLKILLDFWSKA